MLTPGELATSFKGIEATFFVKLLPDTVTETSETEELTNSEVSLSDILFSELVLKASGLLFSK